VARRSLGHAAPRTDTLKRVARQLKQRIRGLFHAGDSIQ